MHLERKPNQQISLLKHCCDGGEKTQVHWNGAIQLPVPTLNVNQREKPSFVGSALKYMLDTALNRLNVVFQHIHIFMSKLLSC